MTEKTTAHAVQAPANKKTPARGRANFAQACIFFAQAQRELRVAILIIHSLQTSVKQSIKIIHFE